MNGIWAVFRKEITQMLRDTQMVFFALAVPVSELILFGVIDMTARDIPTIVWDQSRTQESRQLLEQFENTSYLRITEMATSRKEIEKALIAGRTQVAVEIPPDYARDLTAGRPADVLVMIDGSDSSIATQALSAANGAVLQRSIREMLKRSGREELPMDAHPIMMFNPDMRSANLLIPGLIAIADSPVRAAQVENLRSIGRGVISTTAGVEVSR